MAVKTQTNKDLDLLLEKNKIPTSKLKTKDQKLKVLHELSNEKGDVKAVYKKITGYELKFKEDKNGEVKKTSYIYKLVFNVDGKVSRQLDFGSREKMFHLIKKFVAEKFEIKISEHKLKKSQDNIINANGLKCGDDKITIKSSVPNLTEIVFEPEEELDTSNLIDVNDLVDDGTEEKPAKQPKEVNIITAPLTRQQIAKKPRKVKTSEDEDEKPKQKKATKQKKKKEEDDEDDEDDEEDQPKKTKKTSKKDEKPTKVKKVSKKEVSEDEEEED